MKTKHIPLYAAVLFLLMLFFLGISVENNESFQNPTSAQAMELLGKIGTPFEELKGLPGMDYRSVNIPNASGQCIGDAQGNVLYFFFGSQDFPGLADLKAEYSNQLKCAGIVCTIGEVYPEITKDTPLENFCSSLGVSEYTYVFEDAPDQGWLRFVWADYAVWIDTNGNITDSDDASNISIKPNYTILIIDERLANENALIRDRCWRNYLSSDIQP